MNKDILYARCKELRADGATWTQVTAELKKQKIISSPTTEREVISLYREVAGQMATYGKLEKTSFKDDNTKFLEFIGATAADMKRQYPGRYILK